MLGCFGSSDINGSDGLFYGGGAFFGKQIAAALFASVHSFLFTYGLLWLINKFTPVRVTDEEHQENLDAFELGEESYIMEGSSMSVSAFNETPMESRGKRILHPTSPNLSPISSQPETGSRTRTGGYYHSCFHSPQSSPNRQRCCNGYLMSEWSELRCE
jgi:hypothetical protein